MGKNGILGASLNEISTKFTSLKQQQYALNMQIRLAMQIHDVQAQENLEKEMEKITEQLKSVAVCS